MADRVDLPIDGAGGHEGMGWAATKVAFWPPPGGDYAPIW
jgi:hypothetical protein